MVPEHKNHNLTAEVFKAYPESMRLTPNEKSAAVEMIKVGGNKQKIRLLLVEKRDCPPIRLKQLHNLQTNIRQGSATGTDLDKLLIEMQKIPDATIKIAVDHDDNLVGIYFQDGRMKKFYEMYPEVILIDATYKLNNRRMPLFVSR